MTRKHAFQAFGALILLALVGLLVWVMNLTAPKTRRAPPATVTPLVRVMEARPSSEAVTVSGFGVIQAADEFDLRLEVGGRVARIHPDLEPGGLIPAGETIISLEKDEFDLAVETARIALEQARAAYEIEAGRQVIAAEELKLLERDPTVSLDQSSRALALRQPQLRQVEADMMRAQADLDKALLDRRRSTLAFSRDLIITDAPAEIGEVLGARELAGHGVSAEKLWMEVRLPEDKLFRLMRQEGEVSATVKTQGGGRAFNAHIARFLPELSEDSRMGAVILEIPNPYQGADSSRPDIFIGAYGEAVIAAGEIADVIPAPRRAVLDNSRINVADKDDRLRIREIDTVWEMDETILVSADGFEPGDRLILSRVAGVLPGSAVRIEGATPEPSDDEREDNVSSIAPAGGAAQ